MRMMGEPLNIGVIGLGVMGQRMLARLAQHSRLRATVVWDTNPAAVAQTLARYPLMQAASDAAALIATPGLHSLYIATPPAPHLALSELAFNAGLAVFCEKPLTVDFDAARRCIQRIEAEGHRAAVNFALASSQGLALLQRTFGNGSSLPLGALTGIELDIAFAAWPRPWQAAAGAWLGERVEGGFTREVLSHFVFVMQRVLGPLSVQRSVVDVPADGIAAETALQADLTVPGVPIRIEAKVAGDIADQNRMIWRAAEGEIALGTWFSQITQRPRDTDLPEPIDQLDQWAALIEGRPHSLPGYDESLAVQQTIEALLELKV